LGVLLYLGQLATHCNKVMVALEKWLYVLVSEHIAASEEEILL
jgi:hypothetical protein